jgi:septal ring factor EnvC (AmiA/AmiB activator)
MARTASIILTKEDKKAKIAELNESIKETKALIKGVVAAAKENDAALKAATKEHAGVAKALTKETDKYAKDLATFEAQKSALVNDTSIGANIGAPVVKRTRRTKAEMEAARAAASA